MIHGRMTGMTTGKKEKRKKKKKIGLIINKIGKKTPLKVALNQQTDESRNCWVLLIT